MNCHSVASIVLNKSFGKVAESQIAVKRKDFNVVAETSFRVVTADHVDRLFAAAQNLPFCKSTLEFG